MWISYYEQDDGQDLMNALESYFLHFAGYLSGAFNVFYSIVGFVVAVGIREFAKEGFGTFIMRTLVLFAAGFYYFLLCCMFTICLIVKISYFLFFYL